MKKKYQMDLVLFVFYAKMWSFRRSRTQNAMFFATLI